MVQGFVYLAAVTGAYSRKVAVWRASINGDTAVCVEAVEKALACHGGLAIVDVG
jgi:putative transposase